MRGAAETTGSGVGVPGRPVGKGETDKGGGTTGSVGNRDSSSESGVGVEEVEKGKSDSSKTTCREMRTRREVRSKQRYPGGVRLTRTPEDTKVIVARRGTKEGVVWSGCRGSSGRKTVEQVGGGVESLSPEARRQGGLDQKSA